jgi:TP901 family phage tail tape measure protein
MADKNLSLGTIFTGHVDQKFQNAINQLLYITRKWNKEMGKQKDKLRGTVSAWNEYSQAVDNANKQTKKASSQHEVINKQIAKVQGAWNRLKAAFKVTASYGLAAAALFKIVEGLKSGVTEIIEFDQALRNLQAISGATEAEVSVMGETIKDVARTTKFSTVEVAEGMVLLTQAGFTAAEATAAIHAVSQLATGTLANMKTVSDLVTSSVRAFGLEATEASRVADIMANAINRSKLTIDKLRISFNYIGAVAAQTGLALEETAATMMVLANNGLRASTIGTGMRQVLSRLMAPTRKLRDAFESHNIELDKVNPRLVGYQTAMKNLLPVMWDAEKGTVDMTKAFELFGLRGAQAAAVLVRAFAGTGFDDMLSKVYEVGAAEAMASIQAEGLALKMKNLADRLKVVALAIGEGGVAGALGTLLDTLKGVSIAMEYLAKTSIAPLLITLPAFTLLVWGSVKALKGLIWTLMWFSNVSGITTLVIKLSAAWLRFTTFVNVASIAMSRLRAVLLGVQAQIIALNSVLAINPFYALLVTLVAVLTTVTLINRYIRRMREDLEKTRVETEAVTNSILQYRKALEELHIRIQNGEDVSDQYEATLKRLAKK